VQQVEKEIKKKVENSSYTCLFSIVHWFIAECIFSIPKPTLPIKTFINIRSVNCSPCLQKEKILFRRGPKKEEPKKRHKIKTKLDYKNCNRNSWSSYISTSNYSRICVTHQSHSQDGSVEAKETDMTNITPLTSRTNKIEACCLMLSEQSFSLRRLLRFLLFAMKPPLDGK